MKNSDTMHCSSEFGVILSLDSIKKQEGIEETKPIFIFMDVFHVAQIAKLLVNWLYDFKRIQYGDDNGKCVKNT